MRVATIWEQSVQDVRYGLRTMWRQKLFTAMAMLSLGLGIGSAAVIYSFMDAILVRALPVRDPQSLVVLEWRSADRPAVVHGLQGTNFRDPQTGYTSGNFPFPAFELLRANASDVASVFAFSSAGRVNLGGHGHADLVEAQYVSGEYFSVLGVVPAAGRLLGLPDDRAGAPPVAVLGYRYARRRFGEVATAVGQTITIDNVPHTVVGVAGSGFIGVNPASAQDAYLSIGQYLTREARQASDPNRYWVEMMARLRPGVSINRAETELAAAFRNFVASTATTAKERLDLPTLYLDPGAGGLDFLRRQYARPLYVLMSMVGVLLLIACANLANLLLARAAARQREMAVRLGLGAGPGRVVRQLLSESLLLSAVGGLCGLALAGWGIRALTRLMASGREDFTLHAELNTNVLLVTIGVSVVTAILFGLAPAVHAARVDPNAALKQVPSAAGRSGPFAALRHGSGLLVTGQMALCLVLLVGAGLFARTLYNLSAITVGFNPEGVLLFTVNAAQAGYRDERLVRFYEELQERLEALPGVRQATSSIYAPVSGAGSSTGVRVPGVSDPNAGTSFLGIGPRFFTTLAIPLRAGREIDESDVRKGAAIAVVNEVFAKRYFDGQNPVGRRFLLSVSTPVELEIVGVSAGARYNSLKGEIPPVVYIPYSLKFRPLTQMIYELRVDGRPLRFASDVTRVVQSLDSRIPVADVVEHAVRIERTISQERTFAALCGWFAALALVIAAVGLYGTIAYAVARRRVEFGIRVALGAGTRGLVWLVLRQVAAQAGAGVAIGLAATLGLTRFVRSFLFGLEPNDPATLAAAAVGLLLVALIAGYAPARRASTTEAGVVLRNA